MLLSCGFYSLHCSVATELYEGHLYNKIELIASPVMMIVGGGSKTSKTLNPKTSIILHMLLLQLS